MPLNDALELWYLRVHPVWLRRWAAGLVVIALLLVADLLIGYVNTGNILPPAGSKVGLIVALLAVLRGSQAALIFQQLAEALAIILLATALQQRRQQISPPQDLRVAMKLGDYRDYARACLDGVEESLLLWALPLSTLVVYGTAWLLHFSAGGMNIGRLGLPLVALLSFKAFLALLIMLLLLRGVQPLMLGVYIAAAYLINGALGWSAWLLSADGVLDLGLKLPSQYIVAFAQILICVLAVLIVLPLLAQRRHEVQAAFGKLN